MSSSRLETVKTIIAQMIKDLELSHNLNLNMKVSQLPKSSKALREEFSIFKRLAKTLNLNPPSDNLDEYVYFCRAGATNIWKIGWSKSVYNRVASLQVGHDLPLNLEYKVPGNRSLERKIKSHFKEFKTRNKNQSKCEWFKLEKYQIEDVIKQIKSGLF